jgi:hypothetical protein
MSKNGGIGISDHSGWAVLVTVARRWDAPRPRRVELLDDGLPKLPHHHEAGASAGRFCAPRPSSSENRAP